MSSRHIYFATLAAGLMIAAGPGACAQPTPGQAVSASIVSPLPFVSPVFGDNMVLQRGKPDTIWDGLIQAMPSAYRSANTPPPQQPAPTTDGKSASSLQRRAALTP
jgi:hypothetical protein